MEARMKKNNCKEFVSKSAILTSQSRQNAPSDSESDNHQAVINNDVSDMDSSSSSSSIGMPLTPASNNAAPCSSSTFEQPWSTKEKLMLMSIINGTHHAPMHVSCINWVKISTNLMEFYQMRLVDGHKPDATRRYSPGACYRSFKVLEDEFLDIVNPNIRHMPGTCMGIKFMYDKLTREYIAELPQKIAKAEKEARESFQALREDVTDLSEDKLDSLMSRLERELTAMGIDVNDLKRTTKRKATYDIAYCSSNSERDRANSCSVSAEEEKADSEVSPPTDPVDPRVSDWILDNPLESEPAPEHFNDDNLAPNADQLDTLEMSSEMDIVSDSTNNEQHQQATEITRPALVVDVEEEEEDTEITISPTDRSTIGTEPICDLSPKLFPRIHKQPSRRNAKSKSDEEVVQKNAENLAKRKRKGRWSKNKLKNGNGHVEESDEKQTASNKIFRKQSMQRVTKEKEEESVAAKMKDVEKKKIKAKRLEKNIKKIQMKKGTSTKYIPSAMITRRTRIVECEESEVQEKVEERVEKSLATEVEDTSKVTRVPEGTEASKRAHVMRRQITMMEDLEVPEEEVQRKTRGGRKGERSVGNVEEKVEKKTRSLRPLRKAIEKVNEKGTPTALAVDVEEEAEMTFSPNDHSTIRTKPMRDQSPKWFPRIHKQPRRRNAKSKSDEEVVQKNAENLAKRKRKGRWSKNKLKNGNGNVETKDEEEESDEKQTASNKIFRKQSMQRVAKEKEEESVAAKMKEVEKKKIKAKRLEKNIKKIQMKKGTSTKYIPSAMITRGTRIVECEESEVQEKGEKSLATEVEDTSKVTRVPEATEASKRAHVMIRQITMMEDLKVPEEEVQRKTRGGRKRERSEGNVEEKVEKKMKSPPPRRKAMESE